MLDADITGAFTLRVIFRYARVLRAMRVRHAARGHGARRAAAAPRWRGMRRALMITLMPARYAYWQERCHARYAICLRCC